MGICNQRTVIITGAGAGLGRAYALALAAEGANVVQMLTMLGLSPQERAYSSLHAHQESVPAVASFLDAAIQGNAFVVPIAQVLQSAWQARVRGLALIRSQILVSASLESYEVFYDYLKEIVLRDDEEYLELCEVFSLGT